MSARRREGQESRVGAAGRRVTGEGLGEQVFEEKAGVVVGVRLI